MKILREDIDMNVDYQDLGLIESTFMHDKKRLGTAECVLKYKDLVPKLEFGSNTAYNYLVCLLRVFGKEVGIEIPYELRVSEKWVVDPYICCNIEDMSDIELEVELSFDTAIAEFKDAKILVQEIDGVC